MPRTIPFQLATRASRNSAANLPKRRTGCATAPKMTIGKPANKAKKGGKRGSRKQKKTAVTGQQPKPFFPICQLEEKLITAIVKQLKVLPFFRLQQTCRRFHQMAQKDNFRFVTQCKLEHTDNHYVNDNYEEGECEAPGIVVRTTSPYRSSQNYCFKEHGNGALMNLHFEEIHMPGQQWVTKEQCHTLMDHLLENKVTCHTLILNWKEEGHEEEQQKDYFLNFIDKVEAKSLTCYPTTLAIFPEIKEKTKLENLHIESRIHNESELALYPMLFGKFKHLVFRESHYYTDVDVDPFESIDNNIELAKTAVLVHGETEYKAKSYLSGLAEITQHWANADNLSYYKGKDHSFEVYFTVAARDNRTLEVTVGAEKKRVWNSNGLSRYYKIKIVGGQ